MTTTGIAITITDKGRAALVAASGTNAVTISAIGISATAVTPTVTATTLPGEIKRLSTFAGTVTDADTIHITIRDDSADSYALRAFALYLSDGTLFGIYGGDTLFMEKATSAMLMLAVDIQITGSDVTAITFGDTNFLNPAATTEVQGVVELATEAEATTGTDTKRAVTPKGMMAAVKGWLDARFGEGAPSTFVKGLLASASASVMRTALELKSAALQEATYFVAAASYTAADVLAKLQAVDGSGSGLDADTLDGQHGSYYAPLSGAEFTGAVTAPSVTITNNVPNVFPLTISTSGTGPYWYGRIGVVNTVMDRAVFMGLYNGSSLIASHNGSLTDWAPLFINCTNNSDGSPIYLNRYTYIGGNIVWHSGNDGAGSGMDADMLDGRHVSDFALLSGAGFTGAITAPRFAAGWDSGVNGAMSCSNWFRSTGTTGWCNDTYAGGWYMADPTWVRSVNDKSIYTGGRMRADGGVVVTSNEYPVFHSGNDGAGSGMDADTLDGYHADSLARVVAASGNQSSGYRVWSDGFRECWGIVSAATRSMNVVYPISFTSWTLASCDAGRTGDSRVPYVAAAYTTYLTLYNPSDSGLATTWRAWGY